MSSPTSEPRLAPVHAEVVWFSGPDVVRFLDDLISQRIGDMEDGEARRSFLLSPQGKLDHVFWVIRDVDRFGLVVEDGRGEELASALARYRIRVDVDIEAPRPAWIVVGPWEGPDVSWAAAERHLVFADEPALPALSEPEYEALRIRSGEPRWGVDVDERTIPHESGLVPSSVDFTKGCFVGQELVARIDSRGGNVPRNLRMLEADGTQLHPGQELASDGKVVGLVTSAAGIHGLAMVRREVEVGDTVSADGAEVAIRELPTR